MPSLRSTCAQSAEPIEPTTRSSLPAGASVRSTGSAQFLDPVPEGFDEDCSGLLFANLTAELAEHFPPQLAKTQFAARVYLWWSIGHKLFEGSMLGEAAG